MIVVRVEEIVKRIKLYSKESNIIPYSVNTQFTLTTISEVLILK